ncbi:SDR family oxidoreductase [Halomarina pelagica]|uniref:SDR family oxidoreductase n=1 Tax=Halomarina pelagica TaxID=2961599 RepID=UPI0020C51D8C|nr:SDR family oxidoreductase [Halomarina sp. BND7]
MTSERPLDGEAVLVSGASAGIGRATAHALAADGANVAVAARREERLRELAAEIADEHGVETLVAPTDVTDPDAVEETVERTVEAFGGLNVVVNNAAIGTSRGTAVDELPIEQFERVMRVNTDGMFFVARATLAHLRASNGVLVFVGSFAGKYPRPGAPVYAASKWWTRGFALSLAGHVGDDVAVSLVSPSEVRTEFGREFREETNRDRLPEGEVHEPEDVADAVAFAARQEPPNAVAELDLFRRRKLEDF